MRGINHVRVVHMDYRERALATCTLRGVDSNLPADD